MPTFPVFGRLWFELLPLPILGRFPGRFPLPTFPLFGRLLLELLPFPTFGRFPGRFPLPMFPVFGRLLELFPFPTFGRFPGRFPLPMFPLFGRLELLPLLTEGRVLWLFPFTSVPVGLLFPWLPEEMDGREPVEGRLLPPFPRLRSE